MKYEYWVGDCWICIAYNESSSHQTVKQSNSLTNHLSTRTEIYLSNDSYNLLIMGELPPPPHKNWETSCSFRERGG